MRGISRKPVTKDNVVETVNLELIPLLRELRAALLRIEAGGGAVASHAATHVSGGVDELVGDLLRLVFPPANYTPGGDALGFHLAGIDDELGALEGVDANLQAQITALGSGGSSHAYCFYHLGPSLSESVERRMFPGYTGADRWSSGTEWTRAHHIIAANGAITQMVVRHPLFSSGLAQTLTYTIFKSAAGGAYVTTGVSGAQSNSLATPFVVPCNIPVSAGDRVGISITFGGGTAMNTTTDNMISAALMTVNT